MLYYFDILGPCKRNEFHCGDGHCIKQQHVCDVYLDCPDGNEELDCKYKKLLDVYQFYTWISTEENRLLVCFALFFIKKYSLFIIVMFICDMIKQNQSKVGDIQF